MADETTTTAPNGDGGAGGGDTATAPSRWDTAIWHESEPGKLKPRWQESLPESFEKYKSTLQNYDSLEGLVKSHSDFMTQARTKGGGIKPLSAESTDEERATYRKAFGIPDEPYQFDKPKELPEGLEWHDDKAKEFGKWAQEQNFTPAQAKGAMDIYMKFRADEMQHIKAARQQAVEQQLSAEQEVLRTEFGGKLDGTVLKAKQAALHYGIPAESLDPKNPRFLGSTMLKILNDVYAMKGESQMPNAAQVVNSDPLRQAKSMREKGHPDYDALKRGDKTALAKYQGLLAKAQDAGLI